MRAGFLPWLVASMLLAGHQIGFKTVAARLQGVCLEPRFINSDWVIPNAPHPLCHAIRATGSSTNPRYRVCVDLKDEQCRERSTLDQPCDCSIDYSEERKLPFVTESALIGWSRGQPIGPEPRVEIRPEGQSEQSKVLFDRRPPGAPEYQKLWEKVKTILAENEDHWSNELRENDHPKWLEWNRLTLRTKDLQKNSSYTTAKKLIDRIGFFRPDLAATLMEEKNTIQKEHLMQWKAESLRAPGDSERLGSSEKAKYKNQTKEERREYHRKHSAMSRERLRLQGPSAAKRAHENARQKRWRQNNPEKVAAASRRKFAQMKKNHAIHGSELSDASARPRAEQNIQTGGRQEEGAEHANASITQPLQEAETTANPQPRLGSPNSYKNKERQRINYERYRRNNVDNIKGDGKRWRLENLEKAAERKRKWRTDNRERHKEMNRLYKASRSEERKEIDRVKNREAVRKHRASRSEKEKEADREKNRERRARYRARKSDGAEKARTKEPGQEQQKPAELAISPSLRLSREDQALHEQGQCPDRQNLPPSPPVEQPPQGPQQQPPHSGREDRSAGTFERASQEQRQLQDLEHGQRQQLQRENRDVDEGLVQQPVHDELPDLGQQQLQQQEEQQQQQQQQQPTHPEPPSSRSPGRRRKPANPTKDKSSGGPL